jgi:hypothetical protein
MRLPCIPIHPQHITVSPPTLAQVTHCVFPRRRTVPLPRLEGRRPSFKFPSDARRLSLPPVNVHEWSAAPTRSPGRRGRTRSAWVLRQRISSFSAGARVNLHPRFLTGVPRVLQGFTPLAPSSTVSTGDGVYEHAATADLPRWPVHSRPTSTAPQG